MSVSTSAELSDATTELRVFENHFDAGAFVLNHVTGEMKLSEKCADILSAPVGGGMDDVIAAFPRQARGALRPILMEDSGNLSLKRNDGLRVAITWKRDGDLIRGVMRKLLADKSHATAEREAESARPVGAVAALPFAAILFDRELEPVFVNALAEHLIERDPVTGVGRLAIYKVGIDEVCAVEELPLAKVFRTGAPASVSDIEKIAPDGTRIPLIVWANAYKYDADGQVEQAICVVLTSDHQSMTNQIRRIRAEAENAARAKNRFLANISHELRTPLTAILGFLQLTKQGEPLTRAQQRNIELAAESGKKLQSLIDNILEVALIEANELQLEDTRFDLRELVASLDEIYGSRAELKGLRFSVRVEDSLGVIEADRDKLRQMMSALLDNAIKFTSQGTVRIELSRDDTNLIIQVSDSGRGIPLERQSRLFEPFQDQLDYQMEHGQATGLGLAICNRYVQLMGGSVEVDSAPGRGSVFRIDLPLLSGQGPSAAAGNECEDDFIDDDFVDDDFGEALAEDEKDVLGAAMKSLDQDVREALREAILCADPVHFRGVISGSELRADQVRQIEFLIDSFQYDEVLALLS